MTFQWRHAASVAIAIAFMFSLGELTQLPLTDRSEVSAQAQQNAATNQRRKTEGAETTANNQSETIELNRKLTEYTRQLAVFTKALVFATVGLGVLAGLQIVSAIYVAFNQLRAYVIVQTADMLNVAPLPQPIGGQLFQPTAATQGNAAFGPGVKVITKNVGQTLAHEVRTWVGIVLREFPLQAPLPEAQQLAGEADVAAVLGPGVATSQTRWLPHALSPQDIANLQMNTTAIYVYGRITYLTFFGRRRTTNFRGVHNGQSGLIGVSTTLSFTAEGNQAN